MHERVQLCQGPQIEHATFGCEHSGSHPQSAWPPSASKTFYEVGQRSLERLFPGSQRTAEKQQHSVQASQELDVSEQLMSPALLAKEL